MLFAALALVSLIGLLLANSPTVSVIWLILTYVSSALYVCYLGQTYLAAIIVLVNVGAVALLVLFASLLLSQRLLGASGTARTPGWSVYLALGALFSLLPATNLVSTSTVPYLHTDAIDAVAASLYVTEPIALIGLAILLTLAVGASLLITQS